MTTQDPNDPQSLFDCLASDPADGRAAEGRRDEGMRASSASAGDDFLDLAMDLMREYARTHPEVWSDDFAAWVAPQLPPMKTARVLGVVYKRAAARGWICKTDQFRPSNSSNKMPKQVWHSRIYIGRAAA